MILVHTDKEVTCYNDKTNKYYTSRQLNVSGPTGWDYKKHILSGVQAPLGYDILGWWSDE